MSPEQPAEPCLPERTFSVGGSTFRVIQLVVGDEGWTPERVESACALERVNNPDADGTDFAHPAFWRGEEQSCHLASATVKKLCSGEESNEGVCREPWESARQAIIALRDERNRLFFELKAQQQAP